MRNEYLIKNINISNVIKIINITDPKTPPIIMADEVSALLVITGVGTIRYTLSLQHAACIITHH